MNGLEEIQDDPCVGLFWYDPDEDDLFGVESSIATGLSFKPDVFFRSNVKTNGMTLKLAWEKRLRREKDPRFKGSYDSFPRGYVVEIENEGYKVFVGSWIDEHPSARKLIVDEFQLPEGKTEFVKNDHLTRCEVLFRKCHRVDCASFEPASSNCAT